jgi:hypothetical protein
LLTLLVVGLTNRKYISVHKRLTEFTEDDFDLLIETLDKVGTLVATPNTLTEASNWLRYIREPARSEIQDTFRKFINGYREIAIDSRSACARTEFIRLGLADCAVLEVARDDVVILSTDLDLYLAALASNYACINFNHLRDARFSGEI